MKGNERYNIYSCSKPITCVAAMQLWEKGLFSLDDKLSDYMSEFSEMYVRNEGCVKKAEKPILIKHLAVDVANGLSIYHAQHMLSSPNQEIRSWVYRYVMAELLGKEEFKKLIKESVLSNEYRFTF